MATEWHDSEEGLATPMAASLPRFTEDKYIVNLLDVPTLCFMVYPDPHSLPIFTVHWRNSSQGFLSYLTTHA